MLRRTSTTVIWLTSLSMAHATRPSGDLQYFLPQEFLLDLPLREGSFANEVMDMLQSQEFQDVHAEDVDAGILQNVYATSNLNAPDYKAARRICTRVPVGYNKGGDSRMCERPGAIAPRAIINSPTPGVEFSEGNFQLVAEFEMSLKGHLHLWTKTCVMMCWKNQLCDNDVTLTGSFRVTSSVEVIRNPSTGLMGLQPTTKFDFTDGPHSNGCSEDWLLHFFRDVNKDISISVKALVQKWVTETLQPQIKMEQTVQLMPNLTMTYLITRFDFVPDWQDTDGRGYVRIHVNTSIFAVAPNGTVRRSMASFEKIHELPLRRDVCILTDPTL